MSDSSDDEEEFTPEEIEEIRKRSTPAALMLYLLRVFWPAFAIIATVWGIYFVLAWINR